MDTVTLIVTVAASWIGLSVATAGLVALAGRRRNSAPARDSLPHWSEV